MSIRNLKIHLEQHKNKLLNRTYTPHPRDVFFIDPTGLCNLGCRFCAYPKLESGYSMSMDLYNKILYQALDMGFTYFFLTPMLGDAFMDKTIFEKLDILENESRVQKFSFYTNFVLAKNIRKICSYKKIHKLEISVYGLNENDFELVTTKNVKQFNKFLNNLKELRDIILNEDIFNGELHFSIRTKVNKKILAASQKTKLEIMLNKDGEVVEILNSLKKVSRISVATVTDTWLGVVKQEHVDPLGLVVEEAPPMLGPCVLIFGSIQVRYDGSVHACTRSVKNKLQIGNINNEPLNKILSLKNPVYKSLVDSHKNNDFPDACKECAHYRSVYRDYKSGAGTYNKRTTLEESLDFLSD
tara:strand:- start:972 stop:2039 length:1068 start_codon:yes stop_codon:yes gene_type:complete